MNTTAKIISIRSAREIRDAQADEMAYRAKILAMDKLALLNEMVRFQEERTRVGHLTPKMMTQGKILFASLEATAETHALRVLTRSYRRHLELELAHYLEQKAD